MHSQATETRRRVVRESCTSQIVFGFHHQITLSSIIHTVYYSIIHLCQASPAPTSEIRFVRPSNEAVIPGKEGNILSKCKVKRNPV